MRDRPIWLRNFVSLWWLSGDADYRMGLLQLFVPICSKWLDATTVRGDKQAERSVKLTLWIINRYAVWDLIQHPVGGLEAIVQLNRRLRGLTGLRGLS